MNYVFIRIYSLIFLILFGSPLFAQENQKVEKIEVFKQQHLMHLKNKDGQVVKAYKIALGGQPIGHKTQEGDRKTPEGTYFIQNRNPKSGYHLSLRISYPNAQDIAQAQKRGVSAGGDIMIHGIRNGLGWIGAWHLKYDKWTNGCIAVTNAEIQEIWDLVKDGTPIEIKP